VVNKGTSGNDAIIVSDDIADEMPGATPSGAGPERRSNDSDSAKSENGNLDQAPYDAWLLEGLNPEREARMQQRLREYLQEALRRNPGMGKGAIMGVYAKDPEPRRLIIFTFNERGSILRRVLPEDLKGNHITIRGDDRYLDVRGTGVKRSDVIYFPQYASRAATDREERQMVYEALRHLGLTAGWGYEDDVHMRSHPTLRGHLADARERQLTGSYGAFRPFDRTLTSAAIMKEYVAETFETIKPFIDRLQHHHEHLASSTRRTEAQQAASNFFEESQKLSDLILLEMVSRKGQGQARLAS
jgi:hypothetical protein